MSAASEQRSGRWSLEQRENGARLTYAPSKSDERFTLTLSRAQIAAARACARKQDAAGVRDLLLTPEFRARTIQGAAISALIAANTWRWALPLFGGPQPAGRRPARATPA
jgi:hypothetical protein